MVQNKASSRHGAYLPKPVFFIFAVIAVLLVANAASQRAHARENPRYSSFVMDADTGLILHERYADKPLHPASLTKMMTLLMTFEALEQGKIGLKTRIPVSHHAASMVPSKLDLKPGSSIKVQDAIYALVTKSANDVAVALAEHIGGSESNFAQMMTRRARQLGMSRTTFRNASGLHDKRQISTARDMARLAAVIINDYPAYYHYFAKKSFAYNGRSYHNHNKLMNSYQGMDGMKTGYIAPSGFNLVASAVRNNRRLIGVVFGGRSSHSRNAHMAQLLDRGFARLNEIRVAHAQVPLPPRKPEALTALAAASPAEIRPAGGDAAAARWASVNPALQNGDFSRLIGEGDYDPAVIRRIETGLLAISAYKGETGVEQEPQAGLQTASYRPATHVPDNTRRDWAIQVGAFNNRDKTDRVIHNALKILPSHLSYASPVVAPLHTGGGWLYRARITGYTEKDAAQACSYLRDCLTVSPQNN